jgi:UDPglucose--hexose-1-phosphate uridylyltransferase
VNQLRLDPLSGRWIAVATERKEPSAIFAPRPLYPEDQRADCPFCPGHEGLTPPALETYGSGGEWAIRVVPNLNPAFEGSRPFVVDHKGPVFSEAPATGIHEVLIFSPEHDLSWADFSDEQCALVMTALRNRIEAHQNTPGLRYSQAIVNSGREAGSSVEHPHGQLLGIPFVPRELVDEQGSFTRFAGGCLLCTASASEEQAGHRIVDAAEHAVVYSPYWAGSPYEMLVVPRKHEAHLHAADGDALAGVGRAIRDGLASLRQALGEVAFNVVFHAAPYRATAPFHWHVHILPKMTTRAGFELGTGVYINVIAPEQGADELRAGLQHVRSAHAVR